MSKKDFAYEIAAYVSTHKEYTQMTAQQAIVEAVNVLMNDIGAAQRYLDIMEIDVDLYDSGVPYTRAFAQGEGVS